MAFCISTGIKININYNSNSLGYVYCNVVLKCVDLRLHVT